MINPRPKAELCVRINNLDAVPRVPAAGGATTSLNAAFGSSATGRPVLVCSAIGACAVQHNGTATMSRLIVSRCRRHLALPLCVLAAPAFAGDITVNTTAGDNVANGSCSLREAMQSQFNGTAHQGCTGASAAGRTRSSSPPAAPIPCRCSSPTSSPRAR
jgi:CSLREA domain-containing protein